MREYLEAYVEDLRMEILFTATCTRERMETLGETMEQAVHIAQHSSRPSIQALRRIDTFRIRYTGAYNRAVETIVEEEVHDVYLRYTLRNLYIEA